VPIVPRAWKLAAAEKPKGTSRRRVP